MHSRSLVRPLQTELGGFHPRLLLARVLMLPLPPYAGGRLRALFLRAVGYRIGPHTVILGSPRIVGPTRLSQRFVIGEHCYISMSAYFDLAYDIVIGAGATVTKDIPANSLAAGVPAKVIRQLDDS